jgi:hypothetical protein
MVTVMSMVMGHTPRATNSNPTGTLTIVRVMAEVGVRVKGRVILGMGTEPLLPSAIIIQTFTLCPLNGSTRGKWFGSMWIIIIRDKVFLCLRIITPDYFI